MNKKELLKIKDPFHPTPKEEYELALYIGNKRFGSECKHEKVKNGVCENCLRKVFNPKHSYSSP